MEQAQQIYQIARRIGAVICGGLSWVLGGLDILLGALLLLIVLDYIAGFLCAIAQKNLSSKICRAGIIKKVFTLIIVALAVVVDRVMGDGSVVRTMTIAFFISNEGISILENACKAGLPVPEPLKNVLIQLRGDKKKGNDENV